MTQKVLVSFVFNSPMLVPWGIVQGVMPADMMEKILLWQEAHRQGYRYHENDSVAEVNNPTQLLTIRKILRKKVGEGIAARHQLIGMECYWWQDPSEDLSPTLQGIKRAPGATPLES